MNYLLTSLTVFKKIVDEKIPFSNAVNDVCRHKIVGDNRKVITTLCGCALRHFLILDHRFSNPIIQKEERYAAILATGNLLFAKKISNEETFEFLKSNMSEEAYVEAKKLIDLFLDGEPLIPASLSNSSLEFLSFRYNTPLWLVKMWHKHYSFKNMFKILKANSKHFNTYVKVNNEYIDDERFLIENPIFSPAPIEKFYLFNDKTQIKKTNNYLTEKIYVYPMAFDEILDISEADSFRGIAAYTSTPNNLLSALSSKLTSYVECDYLIGKQQAYFEIKQEKNNYNLKNVHLYEGKSSSAITCISKKVHTFFVLPESSNFFLLRNQPDHFILFEQNSLDEIIKNELESLNNCAEFVELNGFLVYEIPTISEKESHGVIKSFLNTHKEFELVSDKQIFPYQEYDTSMYYAVMKKVREND